MSAMIDDTDTDTIRIVLDLPIVTLDHAAFRGGVAIRDRRELIRMLNDPARLRALQEAVARGITEEFRKIRELEKGAAEADLDMPF